MVVPCRHCHDETASHRMDRQATREIVCMACGHRGPAGSECESCGEQLAAQRPTQRIRMAESRRAASRRGSKVQYHGCGWCFGKICSAV